MKAMRYYGARDIRYESMDDPTLASACDAIIDARENGTMKRELTL